MNPINVPAPLPAPSGTCPDHAQCWLCWFQPPASQPDHRVQQQDCRTMADCVCTGCLVSIERCWLHVLCQSLQELACVVGLENGPQVKRADLEFRIRAVFWGPQTGSRREHWICAVFPAEA